MLGSAVHVDGTIMRTLGLSSPIESRICAAMAGRHGSKTGAQACPAADSALLISAMAMNANDLYKNTQTHAHTQDDNTASRS